MRTFATHLRVLARILHHDEKTPVWACCGPGNLLIVPFFLISPDFRYAGKTTFFEIAKNRLCFAKGGIFGHSLAAPTAMVRGVVSSVGGVCRTPMRRREAKPTFNF